MVKVSRLSRKRARQGLWSSRVVGRVLSGLGRQEDLDCVRLWRSWEEVLGPQLASMARPLGRRSQGKFRTLVLGMDDPIVGQELKFFESQILERINNFLGRKMFDKLAFELLGSRVPLDENRGGGPARGVYQTPRPDALGGLEMAGPPGKDKDDPVGGAYRAYIHHFAKAK